MDILQIKYPDADFLSDILIQDDGSGVYIKYWNTTKLGKKPTKAQLTTWTNDETIKKQVRNKATLHRRKEQYGSYHTQLDMLYHDIKNGSQTWVDHIDAVRLDNQLEEYTSG